jgi:hypothetical protein
LAAIRRTAPSRPGAGAHTTTSSHRIPTRLRAAAKAITAPTAASTKSTANVGPCRSMLVTVSVNDDVRGAVRTEIQGNVSATTASPAPMPARTTPASQGTATPSSGRESAISRPSKNPKSLETEAGP